MKELLPTEAISIKKVQLATKAFFLVCGLGMSSWAPMVPYARDRLRLDDSSLGLLLLFLGGGAIIMMPLTGWFINRVGSKRVMLVASLVIALTLPTLLVMQTPVWMALMLFIFGAGIGSVDVAMNAHAVQIQNLAKRPIMSSLHGLFSVGGLCGPLCIGFLIKTGLSPFTSAVCVSILSLLVVLVSYGHLMSAETEKAIMRQFTTHEVIEKGSQNAWLNPQVLLLGAMCFAVFLTEGAILDWSALYLKDYKGQEEALSGMGYAAFSIAMAFMRLIGDGIVSKVSTKGVVMWGCLVSVAGFLLIVGTPWLVTALLGFILVGLGAANIVPVFFSEGGRLKDVSSTVALPVITTIGYAGQLAGPAILGFIAERTSLPVAFLFTAGLLTLVGIRYFIKKDSGMLVSP